MYELISAYHWDNSKMFELIGITLTVNNVPLRDTGVTLSVISETTYRQTCGKEQPSLFQSKARLRTYTGEEIPVEGALEVEVCYGQ